MRAIYNEYLHDRVYIVFKNRCFLVLWTKVDSALKGLMCVSCICIDHESDHERLIEKQEDNYRHYISSMM